MPVNLHVCLNTIIHTFTYIQIEAYSFSRAMEPYKIEKRLGNLVFKYKHLSRHTIACILIDT